MCENWNFIFLLNPHINCDSNITHPRGIQLDIDSQQNQHEITGFNITINNTTEEDGTNESLLKARRLTDLLVSTSGTSSRFTFAGTRKINPDGSGTVTRIITSGYSIEDNANLNINETQMNEIIDGQNAELNEKMNFIYHAINALHSRDGISAIRFLDLACNEKPQGDLEKFHFLRHALSHNKDSLRSDTITRIKTGFGNDYFDFTADKNFDFTADKNFDFASTKNLRNLQTQAQNFLNRIRDDLNNDLQ